MLLTELRRNCFDTFRRDGGGAFDVDVGLKEAQPAAAID
jgi:hypothetical protein